MPKIPPMRVTKVNYPTPKGMGARVRPVVPLSPFTAHRRKWEGCMRCLLASGRNRVVLARGKIPADVLLVGEAPGASEDVLGKPFVGPAGHLLDHILEEAFDNRVSCCFTNLVACFPRDAMVPNKLGAPPEEAIDACQPRLVEMIDMVKPLIIVSVGKLSSKCIGAAMAQAKHKCNRVLDIIHPAAILRADVSQQGLAVQRSIVILRDAAEDFGLLA